jgi:hypothetical protein
MLYPTEGTKSVDNKKETTGENLEKSHERLLD